MTSAGPWSVKGIDPRAREIAKDLARRSGMTLGEWLNQMITEGVEAAEPPPAPTRASGVSAAALNAASLNAPAATSPTATLVAAAAADRGRRAAAEALVSPHEANRISAALDTLTARLEAVESRSSSAINHVDRAVRTALSRLDAGERDTGVILGKVETALNLLRAEQRRADDRVGRLERDGAGRLEALRSLEIAVSRLQPPDTDKIAEAATARMAKRLVEAEARTRAAIDDLAASLAGLDRRLAEADDRAAQQSDRSAAALDQTERQLETLAAELNAQVDRARTELTERLTESLQAAASSDRLETLELAINQLAGQMDQTEQVSAQAIDRMGREVMKIADAISERVSAVEQRTAGVTDQLTQEVGKVVDVMDKRLLRTEQTHTAALHKLSSDISKVAERLTDRIARHEGLTAEAVEGLKAQIGGGDVSTLANELTDRIRRSEERTARLLEEAQARFEARPAATAAPAADPHPAETAPPTAPDSPLADPPHPETPALSAPETAHETAHETTHEAGAPAPRATHGALHDPWDDLDDGGAFVAPAFSDLSAPEDGSGGSAAAPRTQALADPAPTLTAPLSALGSALGSSPGAAPAAHDPFADLGDPFDDAVFAGEIARATTAADDAVAAEEPRRSSLVNREALEALRAAEPMAEIVEPVAPPPRSRPGGAGPDADLLAVFENLDFGDDRGPTLPGAPEGHDDGLFEPRPASGADADDPFVAPVFGAAAFAAPAHSPAPSPADEALFADAPDAHGFDSLDFGDPAPHGGDADSLFSDAPAFAPEAHPHPFGHAADHAPLRDTFTRDAETDSFDAEPDRPLTTRELIAQARSAARAASAGSGGAEPGPEKSLFRGKAKGGKDKAEKPDAPEKPARGPFGLSLPKRKRKDDGVSTVTLLLATAVSLTVTATVLGFMIVNDQGKDEAHGGGLVAKAGDAPTAAPPLTADATAGPPATPANQLAVATAPNPAAVAAGAGAGAGDEGKALYATALAQLQANDPKALPTLIRAAGVGYPAAEFHLSKIYERGGAGQTADLVKARMWAERAAKAGVPEAMFNLGLFMYEGQGGPPDLPGAADWFTRAAKLGLKDAQYNLARLYENGYGVTQNFSLAYQWYLVAADVSGDKEAHADADRLRPTLTVEGRKTAERFAQTFRPEPATAYASAPTTGKVAAAR